VNFDEAFDMLIGHEGGYANDSQDPGGETMWGVTARVARADGYTGDMRDLPRDRAKVIYRAKYWDAVSADELPAGVRFTVFDAAVNSGVGQAIRWLQRSLDIGDDGVMGPMTLDAAQHADGLKLAIVFTAERLDFMTSLPTWGAFGRGWARRISSNLKGLAQ
jgi:lysozyme family protein